MRWLRPAISPPRSIVVDVIAGCFTAFAIMAVIVTTPYWPHGYCGTGVNDPVQYAFDLIFPLGIRYAIVRLFAHSPHRTDSPGSEVVRTAPNSTVTENLAPRANLESPQ